MEVRIVLHWQHAQWLDVHPISGYHLRLLGALWDEQVATGHQAQDNDENEDNREHRSHVARFVRLSWLRFCVVQGKSHGAADFRS